MCRSTTAIERCLLAEFCRCLWLLAHGAGNVMQSCAGPFKEGRLQWSLIVFLHPQAQVMPCHSMMGLALLNLSALACLHSFRLWFLYLTYCSLLATHPHIFQALSQSMDWLSFFVFRSMASVCSAF
mmetsp:Transcript_54768/g.143396  ORF Transcript_54768/g.143396 Transcript_54768/m.143396 type:complete len:126 (+) Transcript_54768:1085-1462(+)